jgi:hypothetical protein
MQVILWMFFNEVPNIIFGSKMENVRGIRRNLKIVTILSPRPLRDI